MAPDRALGGRVPDGERERVVGELVDALLRDDLAAVIRLIESMRACGHPLGAIYADLLVPAAAAVSRQVAADLCSAAAGTLAFCNLQLVLRRYAADFYGERDACEHGCRALLVPGRAVDGGALFSVLLAADILRSEGWDATAAAPLGSAALAEAVHSQWFDLVGVIVGEETAADGAVSDEALGDGAAIVDGITAIRRDGANPEVVVLACGPAFADDAGAAVRIGADHGAADPVSGALRLSRIFNRDLGQKRLA